MLKLYRRLLEFLINLYFRLSRMRAKRELKRWVDTHPDEVAGMEEFWRKKREELEEMNKREFAERKARIAELEAEMRDITQNNKTPRFGGSTGYISGPFPSCRMEE